MARYNPNREAIDALNAKLDRIIELLEAAQPAPFQWPTYPTYPTYPPIEPYTPFMPTTATPYIVTVGDVAGSVRTITTNGAVVGPLADGYWLDTQDGRRVWYQVESTPTDSVSAVSMWTPQPSTEFTVTTTN